MMWGVASTLMARDYKDAQRVAIPIKVIGNTRLYGDKAKNDKERIFAVDGIVGALRSTDYKEPQKIAIPVIGVDRMAKGQNGRRFKENGEPMFSLTGQDRHGVGVNVCVDDDNIIVDGEGEHPNLFVILSEECTVYAVWYEKYECYIAIRKMTPRECFRLQGWPDEYFDRAAIVNSDSQLYKQAGNGVTVSVIKEIAMKMKNEGKE